MPTTLKPLRIGDIVIDFPVILAPMAGYTDLAYRLLCRQFGAPYCITEMMLDRLLLVRGKVRSRLFKLTDQDHPVAGQIIGNEPDVMAQAAKALCEIGFDAIDLNFACPVRKALSRKRGGYLMGRPDLAVEIVRAVKAAVARPVTIKVRQKFLNSDTEENFYRIAEGALAAGAAAVTVHARSVETKYHGPADWEFLAAAKRRFAGSVIIGSGDVSSPAKALEMIERTGVDAASVARGALGNPWFFRQVRDLADGHEPYKPTLAQQREVLLRHFTADCELYGPLKGPRHMRGFGVRYARLHAHPKEVRMAFVHVKRAEDWHAVLDRFYPAE
ncbi:MAG: tRNA dihydrouridine synthase [Phycisphaerae bacterium]